MEDKCNELELILQNISCAIILIEGRQVSIANPRALEILDISKEHLLGKEIDQVLPNHLVAHLSRPIGETPEIREIQFRQRQLIVKQFLVNGDSKQWGVTFIDITEKRRMESILSAVNFSESLGFVFSGIRHEIGNPVNSIKMALSVLRRDLAIYDKKTIGDFVNRSLKEVERIEYLLKALKNYSLFEKPEMHEISVEKFISDFKTMTYEDCQKNGVSFKTLIAPRLTIWADERALHQVLLNLFSNAIDALQDIEIPQIAISAYERDDRVEIKFDDNGKGISKEKQKDLFQPFFTTKTRGTGLGLVIVKKMVHAMGGEISFESYPSVGTVLTIILYKTAPKTLE